jgi:chromosome segregation ATPase
MSDDDLTTIKITIQQLSNDINNLKTQQQSLENRVNILEEKVSELSGKLDILITQGNTTQLILKYVVTPLIIIVGALVGIKLGLP